MERAPCSDPPSVLLSSAREVRVNACGEEMRFSCRTETTVRWSYLECCEPKDGLMAGQTLCFAPARTWPKRRAAQVVSYERAWTEPNAVIRPGYD